MGAAVKDPASLPAVEYFRSGANFTIGDLDITPFTIPHDAADPCGFVFHARGESIRMAVATDLGYMPPNVKAALQVDRRAAAGVEPRPGDAEGWAVSVVGEAAGAVAGGAPVEPRDGGVAGDRSMTGRRARLCWGIFRSRIMCRSWHGFRRSRR